MHLRTSQHTTDTHNPQEETPTPTPTIVIDVETLKDECRRHNIIPSRPNVRRMRRAIELVDAGHITIVKGSFFRRVQSLTSDKIYTTTRTESNCANAAKGSLCKYSMGVRVVESRAEEMARDQVLLDKMEAERSARFDSEYDFNFPF